MAEIPREQEPQPEPEKQPTPQEQPVRVHAEKFFEQKIIEEAKNWAKETVRKWHDEIHPDYVFLNETLATLFGWILKETWEEAYKQKDMPKFYRLDPKSDYFENPKKELTKYREEVVRDYFNKRVGQKENPNIIIFDEECGAGKSSIAATRFIRGNIKNAKIYNAERVPCVVTSNLADWAKPTSKKNSYRGLSTPDEKYQFKELRLDQQLLTGNIVKHPGQRKDAMRYVKELRQIGMDAGKELRSELEKEKISE